MLPQLKQVAKLLFRPDLLDEEQQNTDAGKLVYITGRMSEDVTCSEFNVFVAAAKKFEHFHSYQQMEKIFGAYLMDQDQMPHYVRQFCRLIMESADLDEADQYLSYIRYEMQSGQSDPANKGSGPLFG